MKFNTSTVRFLGGAALIAVGSFAGMPVMAQTTTVPATGTASPAARDGQGHAADSTAHSAHNKGTASSGTGMSAGKSHSNGTAMDATPGAGLRNSSDSKPPTSGAAGR